MGTLYHQLRHSNTPFPFLILPYYAKRKNLVHCRKAEERKVSEPMLSALIFL
ncbi:hypothetical protein CLOLEP_02202 [[Clostridium] leptum DSM 753]|uniref:Uncharacterized protein n=1 Tax=[Clostridium] leptum DSM 753 TaxID=428125 RepID=A7VUF5_9FIRM|nr:hypothetical protein CLOLEP_02202 [[Clostridium] leptum DSM 753]